MCLCNEAMTRIASLIVSLSFVLLLHHMLRPNFVRCRSHLKEGLLRVEESLMAHYQETALCLASGLGPQVPGLSTGVIVCSPACSTFHALSSCTK